MLTPQMESILPATTKRCNFTQLFGNAQPIHLDIGSGKGRILLVQPLGPGFNYLGIERRAKSARFAAEKIEKHQIQNARMLLGEAVEMLQTAFDDASIERASILFPDPWHKRRHKKRRLVAEPLLKELHRVLRPHGIVWIATDHLEYFQTMLATFNASPRFTPHADVPPAQLTHFEIKYTAQARPIHRAGYQRLTTPV